MFKMKSESSSTIKKSCYGTEIIPKTRPIKVSITTRQDLISVLVSAALAYKAEHGPDFHPRIVFDAQALQGFPNCLNLPVNQSMPQVGRSS